MSAQPKTTSDLICASPGFGGWLLANQCSLAISGALQSRLFIIGLTDTGKIWAHERFIEGCRGIWIDNEQLWLTTVYQVWNFRNILPAHTVFPENGSDRLYCPRLSFVTGNIHAHETALDRNGRLVFVNTQYSCLATPDINNSFTPLWKPPFITSLAPEDRCHLNGLAMEDGLPRFVTARGRSDEAKGWKPGQARGGLVISVPDNAIVSDQLSMPHSPFCHKGKLWLVNTGTCEFGTLDLDTGRFQPVCPLPSYGRGLSVINNHAVIGLSLPRKDDGFAKLPLGEVLQKRNSELMCGLVIVNLTSGEIDHWLRFQHTIREVSDLSVVPGVRQASIIGFEDRERISGTISLSQV